MTQLRTEYRKAINDALDEEMKRDHRVFLIGQDIAQYGGVLQVTAGLWDKYGSNRVIDTPISESGVVGLAIGAALMGLRPVVEIMFADFLPLCMDQIVNNAAKMRYLYNGSVCIPLVIRSSFGAGTRSGAQHSQSPESWFVNVPGIKIVMPTTPYDAKGLLKAAIRDLNTVLFLEHKLLLASHGSVPDEDFIVPIGKASIRRKGSDVTVIGYGLMVNKALKAAELLFNQGIDTEVIDLRSIVPFDKETVIDSVCRTGKVIIAHEAPICGGFGGEIAAVIAQEALGYLDRPIIRVGGPSTPVPFSPTLEDYYIPNVNDIIEAVRSMFI